MALGVVSTNTQLCVINTEHTVITDENGGVYLAVLDLSALQSGDTLQLRLKTKVVSGGSAGTMKFVSYANAQTDPSYVEFGPVASDLYVALTLKQTAGTGRSIPWKLIKLG